MTNESGVPEGTITLRGPVVTVNIFGAEYALRAGADPEYIRQVAAEVDRIMRDISGRVKHASATRIAVLAALQLKDQLHQMQRQTQSGQRDLQELARQTDSLLSRLDQTLLEVVE
jgi:cell division protein ZapA